MKIKEVLGGIAGAVVGWFAGGPWGAFQGALLGFGVVSALTYKIPKNNFAAENDSILQQTSSYGEVIPRVYNSDIVAGNIIWLKDKQLQQKKKRTGGVKITQFFMSAAIAIHEDLIDGMGRVWADDKLLLDGRDPLAAGFVLTNVKYRLYRGTRTQMPDPLIEASEGVANTPAFRNLAYVVFEDFPLEKFGNRPPNFKFEIFRGKTASQIDTGANLTRFTTELNTSDTAFPFDWRSPNINLVKYPYKARGTTLYLIGVSLGGASGLPIYYFDENAPLISAASGNNIGGGDSQVQLYLRIIRDLSAPGTDLSRQYLKMSASLLPGVSAATTEPEYDSDTVPEFSISSNIRFFNQYTGWRSPTSQFPEAYPFYNSDIIFVDYNSARFAGSPSTSKRSAFLWDGEKALAVMPASIESASGGTSKYFSLFHGNANNRLYMDGGFMGNAGVLYTYDPEYLGKVSFLGKNRFYALGVRTDGAIGINDLAIVTIDSSYNVQVFDTLGISKPYGANIAALWNATDWYFRAGVKIAVFGDADNIFVPCQRKSNNTWIVRRFRRVGATWTEVNYNVRIRPGIASEFPSDGLRSGIVYVSSNSFIINHATSDLGYPRNSVLCIFKDDATNLAGYTRFSVADIINAEMQRVNAPLYSVAECSDSFVVNGYTIAQQKTALEVINGLQKAANFDIYERNYKIQFRTRGVQTTRATLTNANALQAREVGAPPPPQMIHTLTPQTDVPSRIDIKYKSLEQEFEIGYAHIRRVDSIDSGALEVDIPLVLSADQGQQIADILLKDAERSAQGKFSITVPGLYSHLDPSDIIRVQTDYADVTLRITNLDKGQPGLVNIDAVLENSGGYTSILKGSPGSGQNYVIEKEIQTQPVFFDWPSIATDPLQPGIRVAGLPLGDPTQWQGAAFYSGPATDGPWTPIGAVTQQVSRGGFPNSTASLRLAGPSSCHIISYEGVLRVTFPAGYTPVSVGETGILNKRNLFAYGLPGRWELLYIATFTAVTPGTGIPVNTWDATVFLRGQFGSEHNTGIHDGSDYVVPVSVEALPFYSFTTGLYRDTRFYSAVSFNTVDDDLNQTVTAWSSTGENIKPFSPTGVQGSRNTTRDLTVSWKGRDRTIGEWVEGSENATVDLLLYDIQIMSSGAGNATVKRTISDIAAETYTYTAALQTTDFGSIQNTIYLKIYQRNTLYGRGTPARVSF